MLRGVLVLETDDGHTRRQPVLDGLVIGRTDDCGFVVDDSAASRQHAEIRKREDAFFLKDLGSTNGTLVNGLRMIEGQLRPGDCIKIGDTELHFEVEDAPEPDTGMATFLGTILDASGEAAAVRPKESTSQAFFEAVYTVTNAIASNYDPCDLVDRILETTVKAIHAQRGAVFFAGRGDDLLAACPVCGSVHVIRDERLERSDIGAIRISETVARRVLNGGESVLFQDSDGDAELNDAQSIVSLNLRSIICVPLRAKSGILGILYIDTDRVSDAYTEDDMLLSAAVGNSAGLAIENANMHQELLEKQRIEQEIEFAWTIQESFLVKQWPEGEPRFEVYGETRPAKVVGGDFYDFVRPDEDHVGILVGDVSGKGVPAALSMAQLLAQFRLQAQSIDSPAAVLAALNADLAQRSQRGMFCTLSYLCLDLRTGGVVCANAGHHPAVHLRAFEIGCLGEATGPPAGILPVAPWEDTEGRLEPGETLLLYTDGVVEARRSVSGQDAKTRSGQPDEYELKGLHAVVGRCRDASPKELIDAVNMDVVAYCAPERPHDDCTMIAVKYLGNT